MIIYMIELQNKPNVASLNLKGFSGIFPLNLYRSTFVIFSENCAVLVSQLTSRKQGSLSVGFITYFRVIQTKTYNFHISNTVQIVLRLDDGEKALTSLQNRFFFWTSKQLFAIHFLLATCNVCPLTIPEFFAQTRVSDYWQIIHFTLPFGKAALKFGLPRVTVLACLLFVPTLFLGLQTAYPCPCPYAMDKRA